MISLKKIIWYPHVILTILGLCFVCNAFKTKQSDIAVLEDFYLSTGGPNWDYNSMKNTLIRYDGNYSLGSNWNFAKGPSGEYIVDPCMPNFQGINCTCTSAACNIVSLAPVSFVTPKK